ncbi:PPM-type phosphatase domain-containing protein [Aphelenchoides fujianensis]|nr:PPM-type phosphatase domain-containing protein [Aphelenchoides fujianensis]
MGQTLSEPVTTKETSMCRSAHYNVASCAMQGWRISMEDAHIHLLEAPNDEKAAFFAVYDGHGGARVSQFAGLHLHKRIIGNEHYQQNDFVKAIQTGFLKLDEDLKEDEETKEQMSGTTAVTVLIKDKKIYCGNFFRSFPSAFTRPRGNAVPLSYDHKPTNEPEMQRIQKAGGWVDAGRVNGNLALSRALGDFVFKNNTTLPAEEQIVTALPDVLEMDLVEDHEFIILACDGIWDVVSNQRAVNHCRTRLAEGATPEAVCEELVDICLAPDCELSGVGCDNMTIVLICLLQGLEWEEYVQRLKRTPDVIDHPEGGHEEESVSQQIAANLQIDPRTWSAVSSSTTVTATATTKQHSEDPPLSAAVGSDNFVTPSESPDATHTNAGGEEFEDDSPPTEFVVIAEHPAVVHRRETTVKIRPFLTSISLAPSPFFSQLNSPA